LLPILYFATFATTNWSPVVQMQGDFEVALWVNVVKNARRKAVELAAMQMIVEIPKQITLANLAMRIYHRSKVCVFAKKAMKAVKTVCVG
jgi:hypothetical protein